MAQYTSNVMYKKIQLDKKKRHTTIENNSETFDNSSAAPAKNANFPINS